MKFDVPEDWLKEMAAKEGDSQISAGPSLWPPRSVVAILLQAADILLDEQSYEGTGWEAIHESRSIARQWLESTETPNALPPGP